MSRGDLSHPPRAQTSRTVRWIWPEDSDRDAPDAARLGSDFIKTPRGCPRTRRSPERRILPPMKRAVFLDRDDTLIANRAVTAHAPHPGDLFDPGLVQFLPGVAEGLRNLRGAGFLLVCVTNQGCVARGHATIEQVLATNRRLRDLLAAESADLDALYFCPYHPRGTVAPWNREHPWRKPAPGMFLQAADDLAIDLAQSWMIGDAPRDLDAAVAAGIPAPHALLLSDRFTFLEAARSIGRSRTVAAPTDAPHR